MEVTSWFWFLFSFHIMKPLIPILPFLCVREKPACPWKVYQPGLPVFKATENRTWFKLGAPTNKSDAQCEPERLIWVFHKHTKLAVLILLPTLYSHIFAVFFSLFARKDGSKCEIPYQWENKDYILRLKTSLLHFFISNGRAKTKLAILAFLYCGEFVKNSILLAQQLPVGRSNKGSWNLERSVTSHTSQK